ncbi:uncharacterized protein ACIQIH_019299 [Cyanocitta cristata]
MSAGMYYLSGADVSHRFSSRITLKPGKLPIPPAVELFPIVGSSPRARPAPSLRRGGPGLGSAPSPRGTGLRLSPGRSGQPRSMIQHFGVSPGLQIPVGCDSSRITLRPGKLPIPPAVELFPIVGSSPRARPAPSLRRGGPGLGSAPSPRGTGLRLSPGRSGQPRSMIQHFGVSPGLQIPVGCDSSRITLRPGKLPIPPAVELFPIVGSSPRARPAPSLRRGGPGLGSAPSPRGTGLRLSPGRSGQPRSMIQHFGVSPGLQIPVGCDRS